MCRVMKTFPCRKSLSFLTTSLGRHTEQIPSLCLFNVNRKKKRRLWRVAAAGNIWLNPHSANHSNMKNIWKTQTGSSLIYPPLISIPGILWMENVGIGFPKPPWPCVSWAYHAVLVSSCRLEQRQHERTHTHTSTLHQAFNDADPACRAPSAGGLNKVCVIWKKTPELMN